MRRLRRRLFLRVFLCSFLFLSCWNSDLSLVLGGWFKWCVDQIRIVVYFARAGFVTDHAEDDRDEKECRYGCDQQTANDSAAKRRVLLAAFAKPERHRHHANDHCERGHQDRTKTGMTGSDRGVERAS